MRRAMSASAADAMIPLAIVARAEEQTMQLARYVAVAAPTTRRGIPAVVAEPMIALVMIVVRRAADC